MITGRQVRAARALLNWKQEMLAEKALVALTALKRLESERGLPVHEGTRDQVRRALEAAGILFVEFRPRSRHHAPERSTDQFGADAVPRPNLNAVTLAGHEYRTISMDSPTMHSPPLDPPVADAAPTDGILTGYDEQHLVTYLRLLDAAKEGADWQEVAKLVLHIDPAREPVRARRAWDTHLARARWMTENGYRHLLRGGAPH